MDKIKWKLTAGLLGPEIIEHRTTEILPKLPLLDILYEHLVETGQADGITKLAPGRYYVKK
jgi:hypothetical protein